MKFKKGDKLIMVNCLEARIHKSKVWTAKSDQFDAHGEEVIFLEDKRGYFACYFLERAQ